MKNISVCVMGLGYIGLPTAALLANHGFQVNGYDINSDIVKTINEGKVHIVEPGLEHSVKSAVRIGNLKASTEPVVSDIYMICVPTPIKFTNNEPIPDISYIMSAIDKLICLLKAGDIVILESTSPVGTTALISDKLNENNVEVSKINFVCCPERVIPGDVMRELLENDRIVGGLTQKATDAACSFYRSFVKGNVLETNAQTAEMAKLAENSYRDINIAYANELSQLCSNLGVNVWELISLTNKHPRVNILNPGPGVGGHCIAVDPWFLVALDVNNSHLIRTAREVNKNKEKWVISEIKSECLRLLSSGETKITIAFLGLAFKPDIDDLRESPSLNIIRTMISQGYEVVCVEPNIECHQDYQLVSFIEALECSVVVGLVKHSEFMTDTSIAALQRVNVLDFCGILSKS